MEKVFLPLKLETSLKIISLSEENIEWYDPAIIRGENLFTFEKKARGLFSEENKLKEYELSFEIEEENVITEGNYYEITIRIRKSTNGNFVIEEDDDKDDSDPNAKKRFVLQKNEGKIYLKLKTEPTHNSVVKVIFKYMEVDDEEEEEATDGRVYTGKLMLVKVPFSDVVNINIDLGSEATQMNYRDSKNSLNSINIINKFNKQLKIEKTNPDDYFFQMDLFNSSLFITGNLLVKKVGGHLYPAKKFDDNDVFYRVLSLKSDLNKKDEDVSYKDWKTSKNNITRLPNPKILAQVNVDHIISSDIVFLDSYGDETDLSLNYPSFIKHFYKSLIEIAINKHRRENGFGEFITIKNFRVVLLMPNVFNQNYITGVVKYLNKAINEKFVKERFGDNPQPNSKHPMVEIFVVSESDAAFMGALRTGNTGVESHKIKKGDKILIIDSGKGTTDFSIVEYLDNNRWKNIKRGGIIGAGQYITNAYFKRLAKLVKESDNRNDYNNKAYDNLISSYTHPEKWQAGYVISEILETIKRKSTDYDTCQLDEKFVEHLKDNVVDNNATYDIKIPSRCIKDDLVKLVVEIVDKIIGNKAEISDIDKIYLTGRNFMFEPFKNLLKTRLNQVVFSKTTGGFFSKKKRVPSEIVVVKDENLKTLAVNIQSPTDFETNANSGLLGQEFDLYKPIKHNNKEYYYIGMQYNDKSIVNKNDIMDALDMQETINISKFTGDAILAPGVLPSANGYYGKLLEEIDKIVVEDCRFILYEKKEEDTKEPETQKPVVENQGVVNKNDDANSNNKSDNPDEYKI